MTKEDEAKIRREGFEITREDAKHLLAFIDLHDPTHHSIEPEIVVRLELIAGKFYLKESGVA